MPPSGLNAPAAPPARFYRLAWGFYLALAVAGCLWIGLRTQAPIPLSLFLNRAHWPLGCLIDLGVGLAAGLLLVGLWRLGSRLSGTARELEDQLAALLGPVRPADAAALALLSGFGEELFFRGAVQGAFGFFPAVLLFALLHSGPGRALRLWSLFALVAGALFGGLLLWRGNLLAPIVAHFVVNCINLQALSRRLRESGRLPGPGFEEEV